ncbi:MAG: hypothetical protein ABI882_14665, partial [Acidobacteriota bacterium]
MAMRSRGTADSFPRIAGVAALVLFAAVHVLTQGRSGVSVSTDAPLKELNRLRVEFSQDSFGSQAERGNRRVISLLIAAGIN